MNPVWAGFIHGGVGREVIFVAKMTEIAFVLHYMLMSFPWLIDG